MCNTIKSQGSRLKLSGDDLMRAGWVALQYFLDANIGSNQCGPVLS